eukprot:SAG25_NODE_305_length_10124_cov_16.774464_12_plen_508_part_00
MLQDATAPALGSTYGLISGRFEVHQTEGRPGARPTLFTYAEADAHLFLQQFSDLRGAPLKMVRSYVLDSNKKSEGRVAHLVVRPPPNRCARVDAKIATRKPNDQKQLNDAGRAALQRDCVYARKEGRRGQLWKGSKVWSLEYRCRGTPLCDVPEPRACGCDCTLRVLFTATIEQVAAKQVQIQVMGCNPSQSGSLHSKTKPWSPSDLRQAQEQRAPAWHAVQQQQSQHVDQLKQQLIAQQRLEEGATTAARARATVALESSSSTTAATKSSLETAQHTDCDCPMHRVPLPNTAAVQSVGTAAGTTAATAAGPSMAVDMLRSDLHVAEKLLARSKRKGAAQYTEADRDRILERSALGLQPSTIQAEWGAHAPGLDYIHGVVNNERRRTRLNLPPYEAMHELCQRDNGKRVMLYLVADPDLDPRHRSSSSVPLAALHLVMCADIDMVDSIIMAVGLGIDTKWRTCEGGGCVIGIGAHQRHTTAKQREGRRVEFDAGSLAGQPAYGQSAI